MGWSPVLPHGRILTPPPQHYFQILSHHCAIATRCCCAVAVTQRVTWDQTNITPVGPWARRSTVGCPTQLSKERCSVPTLTRLPAGAWSALHANEHLHTHAHQGVCDWCGNTPHCSLEGAQRCGITPTALQHNTQHSTWELGGVMGFPHRTTSQKVTNGIAPKPFKTPHSAATCLRLQGMSAMRFLKEVQRAEVVREEQSVYNMERGS